MHSLTGSPIKLWRKEGTVRFIPDLASVVDNICLVI